VQPVAALRDLAGVRHAERGAVDRGFDVVDRDAVALEAGQPERAFVAPVVRRPHLVAAEQRPLIVVEIAAVEFEGHAEAIGWVGVQRDADVADDADAALGDGCADGVDVGLIFEPDIMRAVAHAGKELVGDEDLEDDDEDDDLDDEDEDSDDDDVDDDDLDDDADLDDEDFEEDELDDSEEDEDSDDDDEE